VINDKATPIAMLIFVAFIAFFVFWSIVSIKDTSEECDANRSKKVEEKK